MSSRAPRAGRRTAYASLACTLVAGVVVLLEAVLTDLPGPVSALWWWCSFGVLLVVQLVATGLVPRPRWVPDQVWLPALVLAAMVTFLLYPDHGLTAAFLVVSTATVARHASLRAVVGVIALQTVVATLGIAAIGWPLADVLAGIFAYAGFQAFGALVVLAARGETEARQELAETHAELRSTVALLEATSRDAERLRIARDLHDVVGHQLTALALELEVASHKVRDDAAAEHVARARALAKGLLGDVRTAVGEMRHRGTALEPMLTALAHDIPGLEVSVTVQGVDRVDADEAHVILRVAQEAITNALRHSGASRLALTVTADADGLRVQATDDGRGTDQIVPGHGLLGMRERLEAKGGELVLSSGPGRGFTIEGRLPRLVPAGQPT